jgi:hypothetical protein
MSRGRGPRTGRRRILQTLPTIILFPRDIALNPVAASSVAQYIGFHLKIGTTAIDHSDNGQQSSF